MKLSSSALKLFLPSFNLLGVMMSNPKSAEFNAFPFQMGRLSRSLAIFEKRVCHDITVIAEEELIDSFSIMDLIDLRFASKLPLSS